MRGSVDKFGAGLRLKHPRTPGYNGLRRNTEVPPPPGRHGADLAPFAGNCTGRHPCIPHWEILDEVISVAFDCSTLP